MNAADTEDYYLLNKTELNNLILKSVLEEITTIYIRIQSNSVKYMVTFWMRDCKIHT